MKFARSTRVHYESGPNMTPLVDVVMVILIFLMLAGSFGSAEHYMVSKETALPGVGSTPPPINEVLPVTIEAGINADGGVRLPGRNVAIVDQDALADALTDMLHRVTTESGTPADKVHLVLRPAAGVEWNKLAPVYDAGLRARFEHIAFAASR